MEGLKKLFLNIADLFKIKSLVTLSLTTCAMYLTIKGTMKTEAFIGIYSSVITYYFMKQKEESK